MKKIIFSMGYFLISAVILAGSAAWGDSEMAYCIGQCNDEYYVCVDSVKKGDVDRMTGKTVEDCEKINEKCKAQCEE